MGATSNPGGAPGGGGSMSHVIVTSRTGEERRVEGEPGQSLMETLRSADVEGIQALCGGCCACATCHIYVDPAALNALPPMARDEQELLEGLEYRRSNSRLSCQLRMGADLDGLHLTVAPEG
jgi:2Fe-2S ferredoxin